MKARAVCSFGAVLMITSVAAAQPPREAVIEPEWDDAEKPRLMTGIGTSVTVGAAAVGFLDDFGRDVTDIGGGWDARVVVGTRNIIAGEAAYMGSVQNVQALGLDGGALLVGNGAEGAVRINFLPGLLQPYLIAGIGFTHYEVSNEDFNTSNVHDSDNSVHFPLGGGLAFRYDGLVLDARGVIRPQGEADLVENGDTTMTAWSGNLSGGWEF